MIPHLFWKRKIPDKLPPGVQKIVDKLKKTKSKEQCLKQAYESVSKKYRGRKWLTFTKFWDLFRCSVKSIWGRKGFLHCTNLNYILRVLLIKSGKFKESDIKPKITFVGISIHQYLRVKINNKYVDVDPWGEAYGIKFGKHA